MASGGKVWQLSPPEEPPNCTNVALLWPPILKGRFWGSAAFTAAIDRQGFSHKEILEQRLYSNSIREDWFMIANFVRSSKSHRDLNTSL